jgi:hypothetical protein
VGKGLNKEILEFLEGVEFFSASLPVGAGKKKVSVR